MNQRTKIILGIVLLLGASLRFYGLGWGTDHQTGQFHRFHIDEATLIESAGLIGEDIFEIKSSYGKAPMYLLWAGAHLTGSLTGIQPFDLSDNKSVKFTHTFGRFTSAILGVILIYLVYRLGTAIGGQWTGLLAAFFFAVCPGHIQQSHYYTVDPFITFWVTLALCLALRLPSSDWQLYFLYGTICGLAAGTRLVGIWLAIPFFIVHIIPHLKNNKGLKQLLPPLAQGHTLGVDWKHLAITTAAGAITLLICEPFILLDPQHYFNATDVRSLTSSVRVASGELIRVWTLYDLNTTPLLFYITNLLPYALGFPLALAALCGFALALWKRNAPALLLLGWLIPYFLLVGGLHTKPIRYTTPMLPVLVIFAAWTCVYAGQKFKPQLSFAAILPALFIGVPTLAHGLAIAQIYGQQDSRIVASRWVQKHISHQSHVLVENGGFPTAWMAPADQYNRHKTDTSYFINARDWILPEMQIEFFRDRIATADWAIIIEENRQRQFMSVPNHYPIGADIYTRLQNEDLGFERVAQFKTRPHVGGWFFDETDAEPTRTAFDHPTVTIYKHKSDVSTAAILNQWIKTVQTQTDQPAIHIKDGVKAFHKQDWAQARAAFETALEKHPTFALSHLLIAEIDLKQGNESAWQKRWDTAIVQAGQITKYSFIGMINVGLKSEGVIYLEDAALKPGSDPNLKDLARSTYNEIGHEYQDKGAHEKATEAFARSITLDPEQPEAYTGAANSLINLGDYKDAEILLNKAIQIDNRFPPTHQALSRLYQQQTDLESAYRAFIRSLALDPQNTDHQIELFNIGSTFYQNGDTKMAYIIFEKLLAHNPDFQEVLFNLGVLHLKATEYHRALPHLIKASQLMPGDVQAHFVLASVYDTLNKVEEAIASYQRVLELFPNHSAAKLRLQLLKSP